MKPDELARYREKWREAPRGSDMDGRVFSTDLLARADPDLLSAWDAMAARRYAGEIGWLAPLYADSFRGRQVLELGSGLGFDGLRFAEAGAAWTFADIVPDNLAVIRRVAGLKGLEGRVRFHLIGDDLSFAGLPADYDAIWVFGSIHHVPFEIARREALAALGHLKPGGRWMELVYPRERWLREGAPPFEQWGKLTDGDRTPWAEWHDVEKVRRRLFPAPLRTVLDFEFCAQNYRWFDLRYAAERPFRVADYDLKALSTSCDLLGEPIAREAGRTRLPWRGSSFTCPEGLFARAASIDLAKPLQRLGKVPGVAVDLEVRVSRGSVGIGLVAGNEAYLPAAEAVIDAGPDTRLVTLRAVDGDNAARLVFRNLRAGERSAFSLQSAVLRPAT
jgi:SAM-dependent methyltransferase